MINCLFKLRYFPFLCKATLKVTGLNLGMSKESEAICKATNIQFYSGHEAIDLRSRKYLLFSCRCEDCQVPLADLHTCPFTVHVLASIRHPTCICFLFCGQNQCSLTAGSHKVTYFRRIFIKNYIFSRCV